MILDENLFKQTEELREDFSLNLPTWITKNKEIVKLLNKKGIDLAHATYIPAPIPEDGHNEVFKEARYLRVYRIKEGDGSYARYPRLWIEGVNDEMRLDLEDEARYKAVGNISKKKLMPHVVEFGYIDLANSDNTTAMIKKDRAKRKEGAIALDREKYAQYGSRPLLRLDRGVNGWKHIYGDIEAWITKSGYDKSGYPLNPDKYKKILDDVGLSDYESRLDKYYERIENIRTKVINILTNIDIKGKDSKLARDTYYVTKVFSRVLETYTDLLKEIDYIINNEKTSDEQKNEYIRDIFQGNSWGISVRSLRREIEGAEEILRNFIEQFLTTSQSTNQVEENIIPDTEEDWITIQEDLNESTELNEFAAALMTGIGTSIGAGLIGALQQIFKKEPKAKKSKWIDYKDHLIEKTPEGEFNVYNSDGELIKINLHTIKAAKRFIKNPPEQKSEDELNPVDDAELINKDEEEFNSIAQEVGLTEEVDLEEFRKNELLEGESELDAIKRYKQELIECGYLFNNSESSNSTINEGVMSDLALDVELAGGIDNYVQKLEEEILKLKEELNTKQKQLNSFSLNSTHVKNSGSPYDSEDEQKEAHSAITSEIYEIEKQIKEREAELEIVNNYQNKSDKTDIAA